MTPYKALKPDKSSLFSAPRPMHKYPKESLKKIAVLFTDIVGSTAYFKSHGNRAGREMLQAHQDLASKPIFEHNGVLVKTLGDSVMAYFVDPREAVKSAVKIQHKFREYNEEKTNEEQIHIRVGLHFGEGIIEEKDIFGDVVNMAAKVVQMTENDQIYISQELYDVVKDLSHGIFQLVDTSNKRKVFKGFVIYKVLWHQKAALALIMDMLLYMEPLLDLNKVNIKEAWNSLITSKEKLWGDYIKKESIIPDKSIALIVKDASLSITVAKNILAFLKKKLGMNFEHFPLPIKIIIDFGSYLGAGKLTLEGMEVNWDEIDPGDVYITASAYKFIEDKQCFSVIPPSEAEQPQLFYKIILDEGHTRNKSTLFIYQKALVQGENPPCYYCGDRRHISSQCPSKQLTEITGSLKKLGYLSIGKINKLFYHYLFGEDMDPEAWSETENSPDSLKLLAYHGFYELKTVYQHRFFKAVWDSTTENWEKLKINKIQGLRGGPVWLGQDSIRISDLSQAEKLLKVYLEKTPTDYKAYCSMGFLKMEEDNFSEARVCLDKALGYAKTRPQKILLFFLLSRLYDLNSDTDEAERMISKILLLFPECQEAIYQDIIFRFRKGFPDEALLRLVGLIEKNNEYYINALIDPELEPFSDIIHLELQRLFTEAKIKVFEIVPDAKERLESLKMILNEKEKELGQAESMMLTLEELSKTDSYKGYMEAEQCAQSVISIAEFNIIERKKKIFQMLFELNNQCKNYLLFVNNYPYKSLIKSSHEQLKTVLSKIDEIKAMTASSEISEGFKNAFVQAEELFVDLDKIKSSIKWLENMRKIYYFLSVLFKKSLVFQFLNLVIGLLLLPVIMYYLSLIIPDFSSQRNIWLYQKGFLVIGGISGLFLALFIAIRGLQARS